MSDQRISNLKLSVSSVETFESCPARWYYRYIKKLPSPPTYHTAVGSFIHKILELFLVKHTRDGQSLRTAASQAYRLAQQDEQLQPHLTTEILNESKGWIKELVLKYEQNPELIPNVLEVERAFTFRIEENNITVRGFIDRIDKIENVLTGEEMIRIIDYKTSGNPSYLKPFQLATYAYAVNQLYPNNEIEAAYELIRFKYDRVHYNVSDFASSVVPRFQIAAAKIRHLKKVSPDKPWQAKPSNLCSYCPYKMVCERDRELSAWEV